MHTLPTTLRSQLSVSFTSVFRTAYTQPPSIQAVHLRAYAQNLKLSNGAGPSMRMTPFISHKCTYAFMCKAYTFYSNTRHQAREHTFAAMLLCVQFCVCLRACVFQRGFISHSVCREKLRERFFPSQVFILCLQKQASHLQSIHTHRRRKFTDPIQLDAFAAIDPTSTLCAWVGRCNCDLYLQLPTPRCILLASLQCCGISAWCMEMHEEFMLSAL